MFFFTDFFGGFPDGHHSHCSPQHLILLLLEMQSTCTITIHIMCMTVADISAKVNVVLKKVEAVGQPRARQLLHPSLPYTGDFHFLSVKQKVCYEFE